MRREQILAAARKAFAAKGYHAATMDDVVAASGLSKGSLYWHFRSKEDLLLALADVFAEGVFAAWDAQDRLGLPVLAALRRHGDTAIAALAGERDLSRAYLELLSVPAARERLALVYERTRVHLAREIERGVQSGELVPVAADVAAGLLVGAVEGVLLQFFMDPEFDARRSWEEGWSIFVRGLSA